MTAIMQAGEVLDLINEFEQDFPVNEWRMDGVGVWPLLRHELAWALDPVAVASRRGSRAAAFRRRAVLLGGLVAQARGRLSDGMQADEDGPAHLVVYGDDISRTRLGEAWYDELFDPLRTWAADLGKPSLHLEHGRQLRFPRHLPSRSLQLQIDLLKVSSRRRVPQAYLPGFEGMLERVASLGIAAQFDPARLGSRVAFVTGLARLLERRLVRVDARIAMVNNDGPLAMAMYLAGRRAGVLTVELQHGVQGPMHWGHSRWMNYPPRGYELMPEMHWTWREDEASVIKAWAPPDATVVGGHPWLAYWTSHGDPAVVAAGAKAAVLMGSASTNVLVTLQAGVSTRSWLECLAAVIAAAPAGWRWWVRGRATMSALEVDLVREVVGNNAQVDYDTATDLQLYALLEHVQAHLTEFSTTALEAAALGVPTVSFSSYAGDVFPDLMAQGWLLVEPDPGMVPAALEAQVRAAHQLRRPDLGTAAQAAAALEELMKRAALPRGVRSA